MSNGRLRGFAVSQPLIATPISRPVSSEQTIPWRRKPPVFNLFPLRLQLPTAPVSSNHGCDESRQTPIRIKQGPMICRSPWRACPPQKNVGAATRPMGSHRPVAAGCPAPILGWLALWAICFYCKSVTAPGVQFRPVGSKASRNIWLTGAVETHAKQRVTSKILRSFRMWKHARASLCASALIATTLFVRAFLRS